MAEVRPSADKVIIEQLEEHLAEIESHLDGDVLVYVGPLTFGVDERIRDAIEERKSRRPRRSKLIFLLETEGGYIEVAERMADTIRRHYRRVEFVVPNYAMSAGTVLVMSGDAIHMDYFSTLGPIDPQIERNRTMVPALGYLAQYDRLIKKAQAGTITPAETTYLVTNFDPAELYKYEQAKELSITLLKDWLVKYKFRNWKKTRSRGMHVTPAMRRERAEDIASKLNKTERWHSHARGISLQVVRRYLKLEIEDFGTQKDLNRSIRDYTRVLSDYTAKIGRRAVLHTSGNFEPLPIR